MKRRTKFIYNGMLLSLVGLAMRGVTLALGAYISRAIGAEGVGLNSLVMNVYGFAFTFATAGISLTVTALVASAIGEKSTLREREVMRGAFIYASLFGISASLILSLLSSFISRSVLGVAELSKPILILSISLLPCALTSVISGYFIGRRKVSLNATLQVLGQAARVIFTVALLSRVGRGDTISSITALAIGATLTEISVFLLSLTEFFFARSSVKEKNTSRPDVRAVASVALPIAFSAYIRSALLTIEHAIIPARLLKHGQTREEALSSYGGLHGMALPLILYPLVPLSSLGTLLLPEFAEAKARGERERMRKIASISLSTSLMYAVIVGVLLLFFSEELGYVIYGSYDSGRYVAILAPVVPLMYLDHVADNMLKGVGEQVYSMWVNILDSFLSVSLVFVFLPWLGIEGYAIVIIAMEAFNFTLSILRLRKCVGFKISLLRNGLIPMLFAVASAIITREAFSVSGRAVSVGILISEAVFCISLFSSSMIAVSFVRSSLKKRVKNHHERKSCE